MSLEARIRELVGRSGGRVPAEVLVREALGLPAATGLLARRLAASAVRELRGLALDGEDVVARSTPPARGRIVTLAVVPPRAPTGLPPVVAWLALGDREAASVALSGSGWREAARRLGAELAGATVFALSAATARRALRLASAVAGLGPDEEPRVVALGPVARAAGRPLRSAEEAAALVGEPLPETPEQSAHVLARLVEVLADVVGVSVAELPERADREAVPEFDFGERAFGRAELVGLPEAPGVYVFEDVEGEVAYVGKAANLRRRVGQYFRPEVDERDARIREAAHALSHERTGSELSALLREHRLIAELQPRLNTQEEVHADEARRTPLPGSPPRIGLVQPSAEGGAEVVLVDRARGVAVCEVVPDPDSGEDRRAIEASLAELAGLPPGEGVHAASEVALRWLAARGGEVSVVDAGDEPWQVAELLARLAADPDLVDGRIVPL